MSTGDKSRWYDNHFWPLGGAVCAEICTRSVSERSLRSIGCKRALEPTSWTRKALSRTLKSKDKKLEATRVLFVKSLLNRVKIVCEKSKRNGSACVSCLT